MKIAETLTKYAFDLSGLFGKEDQGWSTASPEVGPPKLKTKQEGPGLTYVNQSPGQTPQEAMAGKQNPLLDLIMAQHALGGQNQGPTITLGGHQQDALTQFMLMHMLSKGMGKGAAAKGEWNNHDDQEAREIGRGMGNEYLGMGPGAELLDASGNHRFAGKKYPRSYIEKVMLPHAKQDLGKFYTKKHLQKAYLEGFVQGAQDEHAQLDSGSLAGLAMPGKKKKTAALTGDLSSIAGQHSGDYAKRIMKQLTPEHFQAAEGAGGEDTIESLVRDIIPREIISRHAMQLGGGDVDMGKAILDSHLKQNPMHTGENLESVLRRMLKANIANTVDTGLKQHMSQLGDFGALKSAPRLSRDDLLQIIQSAGGDQVGPMSGGGKPPAMPEPGLSPAIGYPKTGRFENMKPVLDTMVKEAIPLLTKGIEWARGGPALPTQDVRQNLAVNRFVTPQGKNYQFDPDSFKNVFMQDPSVQRMARGLSPEIMAQIGRAMKPGILGELSRGFQRHFAGRGTHIDAAEQALRNIAAATGYQSTGTGADRAGIAQHLQTMTGVPGKRVGDFLSRNLMAATKPRSGGQASSLFGQPGLGMELTDPIEQMLQKIMLIKSMTSQQPQPTMGAA